MPATRVEIRGLCKYFGRLAAVDDVSFEFAGGKVHGFIGPNGAGKTTTMRMLATLETPDAGDILVDGLRLAGHVDELRPRIGFMPDYLDAQAGMDVADHLDFYARAYDLAPRERLARVRRVVDFAGLGDHLDRPVTTLSKGWKQRLSLARAVVNDPRLVILDEPAAGLDPRARIELRRLVRELADDGRAVLISSHILAELAELCETVTIIEKGRVQASGPVDELARRAGPARQVRARLAAAEADRAGAPADAAVSRTPARLAEFLRTLPGVHGVRVEEDGAVFGHSGDENSRAEILSRLLSEGFAVVDYHAVMPGLEDAFIALTEQTRSE